MRHRRSNEIMFLNERSNRDDARRNEVVDDATDIVSSGVGTCKWLCSSGEGGNTSDWRMLNVMFEVRNSLSFYVPRGGESESSRKWKKNVVKMFQKKVTPIVWSMERNHIRNLTQWWHFCSHRVELMPVRMPHFTKMQNQRKKICKFRFSFISTRRFFLSWIFTFRKCFRNIEISRHTERCPILEIPIDASKLCIHHHHDDRRRDKKKKKIVRSNEIDVRRWTTKSETKIEDTRNRWGERDEMKSNS